MFLCSLRSNRSLLPRLLSLSAFAAVLAGAARADALVAYSGRGIGVRALVANGQAQTIADTGELPAAGGSLSDSVVAAAVPGLLGAAVVDAATTGGANQSHTEAGITDLDVTLPGLAIAVDLLESEATARCSGATPSTSGGATILSLTIGGTPVVVDGTPNQTIPLPLGLGQIVLNQQTVFTSGSVATIDVNALRVLVPSLGIDVALASSHADVDCNVPTSCVAPVLFSGRATVVDATLLGESDALVDTGPLPSRGGLLQSSLLMANLPGLLTASTLAASTTGSGTQSTSDATIASLALTVAGLGISADVATSMAEASCTGGGPTVAGDSVVLNLVVAGTPIAITGTPNQVVPLPLGLGQIVIDEQQSTVGATAAAIDVSALHVYVNGIGDVAVSHTHADVTCVPPPRTFSGRGIIARATTTVPPLDNTIGDTGALPAQGGSLSSSLPSISLPGVLSADLVQSSTSGGGPQSTTSTQLADVDLLASLVHASVVSSNATASCSGSTASVSGASQIANLTVGGLPIIVTGAPNQVVPLLVGTLVLNEQTGGAAGSNGALTVNALHLTAAGIADVVVGSSHADIDCDADALPACPPQPTPTPPPGPTPTPTPPRPTPTPTPAGAGPAPAPTTGVCHHNCPDKIRFRSGLDQLAVKTGFAPGVALDPANQAFRIVLRNASGVLYDASLQPGDLVLRGKKFRFTDKGARRGTGIRGGVSRVEVSQAPNGGIRVNVEAFADLTAATLAEMTVQVTIGDDAVAYTEIWQQKPYGWYLPHR